MLDAAFEGDFADTDWEHGLGGTHAMVIDGDEVLAHASVVERIITVGTHDVRVGYVESVGVSQRQSFLFRNFLRLTVGQGNFIERISWSLIWIPIKID
jgi:hypothetical protein